jgi:hypothetical protein
MKSTQSLSFLISAVIAAALFFLPEAVLAQGGFANAQAQGTAMFNFLIWGLRIVCILAIVVIGGMIALDKTDWTTAGKGFVGVLVAGAATEIVNAVWGNPTT